MNPTPDTVNYLLLGLAVAVVLYGGYLLSLVVRRRNLDKDLDMLRRLDDDPR